MTVTATPSDMTAAGENGHGLRYVGTLYTRPRFEGEGGESLRDLIEVPRVRLTPADDAAGL